MPNGLGHDDVEHKLLPTLVAQEAGKRGGEGGGGGAAGGGDDGIEGREVEG